MTSRRRLSSQFFFHFLALTCLNSCTFSFSKSEYKKALLAVENKEYEAALQHFDKVIKRFSGKPLALESARRGSRIAHLQVKDFSRAAEYYRQIVLLSEDQSERMGAQKMRAQIFFENLLDYQNAIVEYSKLLRLPLSTDEDFQYRFNISKAFYNLNNFDQSRVEIDDLLSRQIDDDKRFEVLVFKGNLLMSTKKLEDASKLYSEIMQKFPERSTKEFVALNLAVCFEEQREFRKAIDILEQVKPNYPTPEFIELKIKRLQGRIANLPGAQGFKK